jgi:hypothetical protein
MNTLILALALAPSAAPPRSPPPVPPTIVVSLALRDIKLSVDPKDRYYTRYFFTWDHTEEWQRVSQLLMNLLSRDSEVQRVRRITPFLWRIDLRDLHWLIETWEKGAAVDYVFHDRLRRPVGTPTPPEVGSFSKRTKGKGSNLRKTPHAGWLQADQILQLSVLTRSQAPILVAEIFFNRASRQRDILNKDNSGVGYYDFLRLENRRDYLKLVDVDVQDPKELSPFGREFRAALDKSGVSTQNRQIVRFQGRGGGVWVTLDTKTQANRGVARNNLRPGEFRHQAEEWYGPLPNGLWVVFTSNNLGVRANVVPGDDFGLHDDSPLNESRSKVIHPVLSCNNCHAGQVLKDFRDDVRKKNEVGTWLGFGSVKKKVDREFRRLYFSDLYFQLVKDRLEYQRAIRLHTILDPSDPNDKGLEPQKAMQLFSRKFYYYSEDGVTLARAARELGVTRDVFLDALRFYARPVDDGEGKEAYRLTNSPLSDFLEKVPRSLTRLTWEDTYPLAQDVLAAYGLELLKRDLRPER